jgi:D-alanyl-D-alanine carboxypeptidase
MPVRVSICDDAVKRLLDMEIDNQMRENNLPGVVVSIVVPGEGEYVAVKGRANLETGRARAAEDPFRVASITKTFTASAILQLVDQGKLGKSDKLSPWFPNFPNADQITVDDLLRMRSGIADSVDAELLRQCYDDPLMKFDTSDSIKRAAGKASQFEPPNQKTKYVNVNYNLLEEIIRYTSGHAIGVQLTEGIFKPLGLKDSQYPTTSDMPGALRGHGWDDRAQKFEDKTVLNPALPGGAGCHHLHGGGFADLCQSPLQGVFPQTRDPKGAARSRTPRRGTTLCQVRCRAGPDRTLLRAQRHDQRFFQRDVLFTRKGCDHHHQCEPARRG